MKVLVAGATGMLGREVVAGLVEQGVDVRVLGRDAKRASALGVPDIKVADARKKQQLAGVCDGVDAVFSCLGASVSLALGAGWRGYKAVDVPANLNLLDEARRAGVSRLVYVSAFVVPETAGLAYFAAHEAVAREVLAAPGGHVLRPTGFFSALGAYLDMARRGPVPVFGDGGARSNPIDDRDLAALAVATTLQGGPAEQAIGGPEILTRRQIGELACDALGRPHRFRKVAPWLARTGATMAAPFHPRLSQLMRFATEVSVRDLIAPQVGTRCLEDWFRQRVARP